MQSSAPSLPYKPRGASCCFVCTPDPFQAQPTADVGAKVERLHPVKLFSFPIFLFEDEGDLDSYAEGSGQRSHVK